MTLMDSLENKQRIAIVAVGYNRLYSLKRLLKSLELAHYDVDNVPLVISVDASGDEKIYDYVRNYQWDFGTKYTIIQAERLGLKNHIFACADLTKFFKAVILLEDDLYVSPFFYDYVQRTLDFYQDDSCVASIGLYSYSSNVYDFLPFSPFQTEYDVYCIQSTITWGECWNERMWSDFKTWLNNNDPIKWESLDIPTVVKDFKRAWSKYFTAYMSKTNRYVIAPYKSYTTNYMEAGEHSNATISSVQVPYVRRMEDLKFGKTEDLIKYDSFYNPVGLEKYLNVPQGELCVDFFSTRPNNKNCRYILTTDILPYKIIQSNGLKTRPIETNIIDGIEGIGVYLYDVTAPDNNNRKHVNTIASIEYRLKMFRPWLLVKYIKHLIKKKILNTVKAVF